MENNQNKRIFARVSALTALLTVGVGIDPPPALRCSSPHRTENVFIPLCIVIIWRRRLEVAAIAERSAAAPSIIRAAVLRILCG